jgi:hypothetical protein
MPAVGTNPSDDLGQEVGPGNPLPLRVGVGEVLSDISQGGCPKQSVGDRVHDHVGVGMPKKSLGMGYRNPS